MRGSSGDLSADRLYGYATDLLNDGDATAAGDLFRQILERVPQWPAAWFGLGQASEAMGDSRAAVDAYGRTLALEPEDALGATPRLARLGAGPAAMTQTYVAALFDEYAPRFDAHLTGALDYRGPEIILAALEACAPARRFRAAMDLGCGTGLMAEALRGRAEAIDGVDLSAAMIERARTRELYRNLLVGDMVLALGRHEPASTWLGDEQAPDRGYDLIVAADVLVYVGDLQALFAAAGRAMARGGLFAFTVQAHEGDGFAIGPDLRFRHGASYIADMAATANLPILHFADCVTRLDAGRAVVGHVAVLGKADG